MKCPACQGANPKSSKFCRHCGSPLQSGQPEFEKIRRKVASGEYGPALEDLQDYNLKHPGRPAALCWWGHALFFSGKTDEAMEKYRQCLDLEPENWEALYQAASIHYTKGRHAEAAAMLETLSRLRPNLAGSLLEPNFQGDPAKFSSGVHLYLAMAQKQLGLLEPAYENLDKAARLDASNSLPWGLKGNWRLEQQRFDEAVEAYAQALKRAEHSSTELALRNDLGVAYSQAGKIDEAAEEFKAVIARDPGNRNAIFNLGVLYLRRGLKDEVQRDWQEFIKADNAAGILFGLTKSMVEAARNVPAPEAGGIVGNSKPMREVMNLVKRASLSEANVLVSGENGTGKELVSLAIHRLGPRKDRPFVAINCGALPEGLLESELFGYEKGAFTGAYRSKPGRFELAQGGTLFLDEIGDLDLGLQVKLLRVLQERTFERLGGTKTLHTDARLIAATQHDLRQSVAQGKFREDLFYRLYVIAIHLPALRERREDIPELAQYLLERISRRNHKRFTGIHPGALKMLADYDWPGNVRQLENVMERAVALYDDTILLPEYLRLEVSDTQAGVESQDTPPKAKATARDSLDEVEKGMILEKLRQSHFKVMEAAKAMGVSRATFYRKMAKYGIEEYEVSSSQK